MNAFNPKTISGCVLLAAAFALPVCAQTESVSRHPVVHIEVLGVDAPRLQSFYRDLFGWPVTLNAVGYGYVPVAPPGSTPLTGGVGPSPQRQALVTFYVKVDDPAAILKKAESLGGKILVAPTDVPGGVTFARLADPEGNVVGIVRRPN